MIKVRIEYTCDKCGKTKKEKPIIKNKGYEDVYYIIQNTSQGYLPEDWLTDLHTLVCPKCAGEEFSIEDGAVAFA